MPDSSRLELVQCAYQECGTAYNTAVNVTLFTWKTFYTRSAAVLAAAGYIVLTEPQLAWLAALLLILSAGATWFITLAQMMRNQAVIRKVIAAGAYLEVRHDELGCRFKLDAFGDELDQSTKLADLWPGPKDLESRPLQRLGVTPKVTELCKVHALVTIGFAMIAIGRWVVYLVS